MNILYPTDWGTLGTTAQLVLMEPKCTRKLEIQLIRVVDGKHALLKDIAYQESVSSSGTTRLYEWSGLEDGNYIANIYEQRFGYSLAQLGFKVSAEHSLPSLASSLDTIERLAFTLQHTRMIGNGIGKSGTTWLYRILGSLPAMSCIDMTANGLNGIDHTELERVPCGKVYHGHLRYGLETVKTLDQLGYYNVHIYRDLRDIVVSEYFHKFHMDRENHRPDLLGKSKDEMLKFENILKWSSSIYAADDPLSWARSGDCIMVKYEDLLANTEYEVNSLLSRLNLPSHSALTQYIVKRNDFTAVSGRKKGDANAISPLRNGIAGNWVEHLDTQTSRQIADKFSTYFETLGYS